MLIYIVIHSHEYGLDVDPFSSAELAEKFMDEIENDPDFDKEREYVELSVKNLRVS